MTRSLCSLQGLPHKVLISHKGKHRDFTVEKTWQVGDHGPRKGTGGSVHLLSQWLKIEHLLRGVPASRCMIRISSETSSRPKQRNILGSNCPVYFGYGKAVKSQREWGTFWIKGEWRVPPLAVTCPLGWSFAIKVILGITGEIRIRYVDWLWHYVNGNFLIWTILWGWEGMSLFLGNLVVKEHYCLQYALKRLKKCIWVCTDYIWYAWRWCTHPCGEC